MYKICYVTSSRADYGIVRKYLTYLNNDNDIDLQILLTGAILDEKYGAGYKIIKDDGFKISYSLKLDFSSTKNTHIINNMSIVLKEFGEYFYKNRFDLVILLGDRYEMLSVATAAAMNKQRILHLHGGEITLGNYDEFIRHSITKMSKYHFTSTEEYRKRVIQLGEHPERVFNIGAIGAENCKKIDIEHIDKDMKKLREEKYFIVLFHSETMTNNSPKKQIKTLLNAIDCYKNVYKFVFIGTNADTNSNEIRKAVKKYILKNKNTIYYENLNPDSYHYLLKYCIALIGNSSSGIIEAPTLGCYTINIGDRQKGRIRGKSVFDIRCEENEIKNTIDKVSELEKKYEFENPYFKENTSKTAYKITKKILENEDKEIKKFYDIK